MSDEDQALHIPPKDAPPVAPPEQHGGDVDIQAIGRFLFSMVVGLALARSTEPMLPAASFAESAAATRAGGLGLALAPGTKLRISKLAVRVLRASAP